MKDVFPIQKNTDSTFVFSFDTIKEFKVYPEKCDYYKGIVNKRHFLRTKNNDIPLNLNFLINCDLPRFCPKEKNTLWLTSDFNGEITYLNEENIIASVDTLNGYLHKQLLNFGKDPRYSKTPKKCVIIVNYHKVNEKSKERLSRALDTVSLAYFRFIKSFENNNIDSLKRVYPLQIFLEKDLRRFDQNGNLIISIPPPPSTFEDLE